MDINKLVALRRKFPHAQLAIQNENGSQCMDFELEFKFTSDGQWKIVIIPKNQNEIKK